MWESNPAAGVGVGVGVGMVVLTTGVAEAAPVGVVVRSLLATRCHADHALGKMRMIPLRSRSSHPWNVLVPALPVRPFYVQLPRRLSNLDSHARRVLPLCSRHFGFLSLFFTQLPTLLLCSALKKLHFFLLSALSCDWDTVKCSNF
jgi:hypothetical protein